MQQPMQPILQHLFQAASLDEVPRQRLESFVEEYPSFGIGHYLLSRKLKAEGSEQFAAETQKTSLYFTNPFWLQWQLDHVALSGGHSDLLAMPVREFRTEDRITTADPIVNDEWIASPEETLVGSPEGSAGPDGAAVAGESHDPDPGDDLAEALSAGSEETTEPSAADLLLRSIEEAKGLRGSLEKINNDFDAEIGVAGETAEPLEEPEAAYERAEAAFPEPEAVVEERLAAFEEPAVKPGAPAEEAIHDEEPPFVLDEPAQTEPEAESAPINDEEPPFVLEETDLPVAAPEAAPVAAETMPEPGPAEAMYEPAGKDLVFEPYHTIDYFASQGIKFMQEENPSDKLGKQLKSFTEWLKGMRRLPRQDREVVPDRVAEEAVQSIAAHSIESKDILTETMAEVLAMQGMRERARAVYEKLSLLNPDKRAYFAAKIEHLNIP